MQRHCWLALNAWRNSGGSAGATVSPPCSNGQFCVVLQVRSEGFQVRIRRWASRALDNRDFNGTLAAHASCRVVKAVHCAGMGKVAAKPPGRQLRQSRADRAQTSNGTAPADPFDKQPFLLKTSEFKWCGRCGARIEEDSAPRVLLKPACGISHQGRALSLLGKKETPEDLRFCGTSVSHL